MNTKKKYTLQSRREMWQTFQHLEKVRAWAFDVRQEAHKEKRMDLEQALGEMIFNIGQATARLRQACKAKFSCRLEDLEVYK